jgi:hypothetical protein
MSVNGSGSVRDLMVAALDQVLASGVVEAAIRNEVEATVKNLLADAFGRYGEFSELLRGALSKSLSLPEELGIPSYNDTLIAIVRDVVNKEIEGTIAARVRNKIVEILEPAPATMKLSEFIESYVAFVKESNIGIGCHCGEGGVTAILDPVDSSGFRGLFLADEPNAEKKNCCFDLRFHNGKLYHFSEKYNSRHPIFGSQYTGFGKRLVWLKEGGTKFEFDCDPSDLDLSIDYHG